MSLVVEDHSHEKETVHSRHLLPPMDMIVMKNYRKHRHVQTTNVQVWLILKFSASLELTICHHKNSHGSAARSEIGWVVLELSKIQIL